MRRLFRILSVALLGAVALSLVGMQSARAGVDDFSFVSMQVDYLLDRGPIKTMASVVPFRSTTTATRSTLSCGP